MFIFLPFLISILYLLSFSFVNPLLTASSNGLKKFSSFNADKYNKNLIYRQYPISLVVVFPIFDKFDCQPNMGLIPRFSNSIKANYTAIVILRTLQCASVLQPLSYLNTMTFILQQNSYPSVVSVIWPVRKYDRVILGAPGSELNNFSPSISDPISYQVVSDTSFSDYAFNNPDTVYTLYNEENPWSMGQKFLNLITSKSSLQAVNLLLFVISIIALACVGSRFRLKGKIQLSLLLSSIFLLGGDLVFSWSNATDIRYQFYQLSILLPCLFSNLFAVLSWTWIVLGLKLVPIKAFRIAIIVESVLLAISLLVLIIFLYFDRYKASSLESWYNTGLYIILGLIISITIIITIYFISKALNFCPLFFEIAKLVNGQRLTLYILMSRVVFLLVLLSTFLDVFFVRSFDSWASFSLFHSISIAIYMIITLLTVNKFQAIQAASYNISTTSDSQQEEILAQNARNLILAANSNTEEPDAEERHNNVNSFNVRSDLAFGHHTANCNLNLNDSSVNTRNSYLSSGIYF